jgi:hypothetical protein
MEGCVAAYKAIYSYNTNTTSREYAYFYDQSHFTGCHSLCFSPVRVVRKGGNSGAWRGACLDEETAFVVAQVLCRGCCRHCSRVVALVLSWVAVVGGKEVVVCGAVADVASAGVRLRCGLFAVVVGFAGVRRRAGLDPDRRDVNFDDAAGRPLSRRRCRHPSDRQLYLCVVFATVTQ